MIQSLQQRVAPCLEFICRFDPSSRHLFYCVIKFIPSDAKAREEQDGSKQKFAGGTTAKLWPDLRLGVTKNRREMKMKDLNPAEEGDFLCKL